MRNLFAGCCSGCRNISTSKISTQAALYWDSLHADVLLQPVVMFSKAILCWNCWLLFIKVNQISKRFGSAAQRPKARYLMIYKETTVDSPWSQTNSKRIRKYDQYQTSSNFIGFLHFYISLMSQLCADALARSSCKNHLVTVGKTSWFGFEYVFWSPRSRAKWSQSCENVHRCPWTCPVMWLKQLCLQRWISCTVHL